MHLTSILVVNTCKKDVQGPSPWKAVSNLHLKKIIHLYLLEVKGFSLSSYCKIVNIAKFIIFKFRIKEILGISFHFFKDTLENRASQLVLILDTFQIIHLFVWLWILISFKGFVLSNTFHLLHSCWVLYHCTSLLLG